MLNFDKNIFRGKKKRNTSLKVENRSELFRAILTQEDINLNQLEELCFEGIPEDNAIKAMCWKVLLGYLPLKTSEWKSHLQQQRNLYEFYINLLFQNPETYNNGEPLNTNNNNHNNDAPIKLMRSQTTADLNLSSFNLEERSSLSYNNNAYFQDDEDIKHNKRAFFEDSDDDRAPKAGLFDTDDDDEDINDIENVNNKEENEVLSDIETPTPSDAQIAHSMNTKILMANIDEEHKDNISPIANNNNTLKLNESNRSNTSNGEEIIFMTPSSKRTSSSYNDDPLLKDLETDDPLHLIPKKEKKIKDRASNLDFAASTAPDPLSQTPNNPWKTYFDDWEIWNRIKKDIHRTHQTYAFFRCNHMICDDSMSKKYRFPFDITSSTAPITPSNDTSPINNESRSSTLSDISDNNKKRMSLKNIIANDDVISDDDDDDKLPVFDAPVPAAKHIKHSKSAEVCISSSYNNMDPNKKARIERYVLDSKQQGIHAQIMIRILCVYARLNKGVEYVQGMNELLAPIYYIFAMDPSSNKKYAEADAFFCFMNLMSYLADRFIAESDHSQLGIIAVVNEFDELLSIADNELWQLLKEQDLDAKFYALRWLMLLMAMEFQLPEVLRLWDSFLSDHNRFEFVTYFGIAMLHRVKPMLMCGSFADNLQLLQKYPSYDLYELLVPAIEFRDKLSKRNLKRKKKKKKTNIRKNKNKNRNNSLKGKHRKIQSDRLDFILKVTSKGKSRSKSPIDLLKRKKKKKDNIMRPQSTRVSTNAIRNSAYNLFRKKKQSSNTVYNRPHSFSISNWKQKWSTKQSNTKPNND